MLKQEQEHFMTTCRVNAIALKWCLTTSASLMNWYTANVT
jgi:hypothetical protein